jgi:hypothetical protein
VEIHCKSESWWSASGSIARGIFGTELSVWNKTRLQPVVRNACIAGKPSFCAYSYKALRTEPINRTQLIILRRLDTCRSEETEQDTGNVRIERKEKRKNQGWFKALTAVNKVYSLVRCNATQSIKHSQTFRRNILQQTFIITDTDIK